MEIKATGLPKTIEDYQVALNAAFAGGKAYGLAQRTWVGLTDEEIERDYYGRHDFVRAVELRIKEKNT
jgi:hypothetical protein